LSAKPTLLQLIDLSLGHCFSRHFPVIMSSQTTPEVLWAQRSSKDDAEKNYIYLTIGTPDVPKSSMKLSLTPTKLTFTGHSETKKTTYHVELEFYAEIDPENSKTHHTDRDVEVVLRKKELKEEFWPRLLKDTKKMHFLKTDFDKWVDEDEQNAVPEDDYMNNFGGAGGMGDDGGFGGIDFSKLGAGAGGAGMPGMEGLDAEGGEGDSDDDDDMPGLEGEADEPSSSKGKEAPKIEEVS